MTSWPWQDTTVTRWPVISPLFRRKLVAEAESIGRSEPLAFVRRVGHVVLGLQFVALLIWTTLLYHRFVLSIDYSEFAQQWYMISHGHLDPYDTIFHYQAWRDHSFLLIWPLAVLDWVWPHGLWLNWIQVSCVVVAELVAFNWLCEIAHERLPSDRSRNAAWLAGVGLVLLVANPWIWESVSFDFHVEMIAVPFAALVACDIAKDRRRAWVWVVPLLLCGDVAGTYLGGIGLGAALFNKKWRRQGAAMACLGICAVLLITLVHGNLGSDGLSGYDYLAVSGPTSQKIGPIALVLGAASHPLRLVGQLWAKRSFIWSNLAPSSLLGILFLPLMPLLMVVLGANMLDTGPFDIPSFQSIVLYVFVPIGTVAVLGYVWRRHALVGRLLASLIVMQALGWAVVWGPQIPGQWLRVPASTAQTLANVQAQIPGSAEVVASSGVLGGFAAHPDVLGLAAPGEIPVAGQTWFIIVPEAGIESLTTDSAMALAGELAGPLHAQLITDANGVWAFRFQPPPGMHTVTVPGGYGHFAPLPAWTASATAGRRVMTGPVSDWHMTATGGKGYVVDGLAWQEPTGQYQAQVTLSASGPVSVELWNDTDYHHDVLLARRYVPATEGREIVELPVAASTAYQEPTFSSWGPFRATFWSAAPGQRLELRVWSPGGEAVNVYSADMTAASGGAGGL